LLHLASVLRDDRRKRTDARKHLIQCGFIGILDVADYRPFLVEKRCHLAILSAAWERKAPVLSRQATARLQLTRNAFQT
jgi:hypothetical protein